MRVLRVRASRWPALASVLLALASAPPAVAVGNITLTADEVVGGDVQVRSLRASVSLAATVGVRADVRQASLAGRSLGPLALRCDNVRMQPGGSVACPKLSVDLGAEHIPGSARYDPSGSAEATLQPSATERWFARMHPQHGRTNVHAELRAVPLRRVQPFLPSGAPQVKSGRADVTVDFIPDGAVAQTARVDLRLAGLGFADAAGLHAAENVDLALKGEAHATAGKWTWQGNADWRRGGVFWQPFYVEAASTSLEATGHWDGARLTIVRGALRHKPVGNFEFEGALDPLQWARATYAIRGQDIDLAQLYAAAVKPLYPAGMLGTLAVRGRADIVVNGHGNRPDRADVALHAAELGDAQGRFAIGPIDGRIPWEAARNGEAALTVAKARIVGIPIGPFRIAASGSGARWHLAPLELPVFDGRFRIDAAEASLAESGWRWSFQGGLTPVSLGDVTQALGWPRFAGTLSGAIPRVAYADDQIAASGSLAARVFDGTLQIRNMRVREPFGTLPRAQADIEMRNLDLDTLTRTFSFGRVRGRIDADVRGLEMAGARPAKFDADVRSSPGTYPKRISQEAVQNLSSLSGGGAAAALQRSVLRIFHDFGYRRIGLRCVLQGAVCSMSGLLDLRGGYEIVEGGGIPAITVMGYNRAVGWEELVTRLARITRENAGVVVH